MIGDRTLRSLAQFLALLETDFVIVLCAKHGLHMSVEGAGLLQALVRVFRNDDGAKVLALLEEIARTRGDLRARINPRYRFEERFADLQRCAQLDGYLFESNQLLQVEPSVGDLPPLEDDLTNALRLSEFPQADAIIEKLGASAEAFRSAAPDYNAALGNARVALETIALAIAQTDSDESAGARKWGSVIAQLRSTDFITTEEERGLAGVFGFVSSGSHRPIGLSEEEMTRLGRHLVLSMCWFLTRRFLARR